MLSNQNSFRIPIPKYHGSISLRATVIFPTKQKEPGKIFLNNRADASQKQRLEELWSLMLLGRSFNC
jgi:hypothetical protein